MPKCCYLVHEAFYYVNVGLRRAKRGLHQGGHHATSLSRGLASARSMDVVGESETAKIWNATLDLKLYETFRALLRLLCAARLIFADVKDIFRRSNPNC